MWSHYDPRRQHDEATDVEPLRRPVPSEEPEEPEAMTLADAQSIRDIAELLDWDQFHALATAVVQVGRRVSALADEDTRKLADLLAPLEVQLVSAGLPPFTGPGAFKAWEQIREMPLS